MGDTTSNARFISVEDEMVAYDDAVTLLQLAVKVRTAGRIGDTIYLLQHQPVITLGRSSDREKNLLASVQDLQLRNISIYESDRGGDITYHAPGQLVCYPVIDLNHHGRDLHRYIRSLEQIMISTLAGFDIESGTVAGRTGVWVGECKIAAIGIKVTRWITSHGFALNVTTDLSPMRRDIVPCGIADQGVTSMSELGKSVTVFEVEHAIVEEFARHFRLTPDYSKSTIAQEIAWLESQMEAVNGN